MIRYQYGQMFKKLGVPGMGRQGSGWCAVDPSGTLVLMADQNLFHRDSDGRWLYEGVGYPSLPESSRTAASSVRMLADYFRPQREILLPIGIFRNDGCVHPDGTAEPAEFDHATGDVYRATMRSFDLQTGHIVCEVVSKFIV
ncbi:hypothetical protein [Noviherbaspirillum aerium]|uniref:hypothetical protein n=1 Tax=Noviherbaspirillum aerium TaxID=2588497 RepID=UPI00124E812A|nr:hypothetical protein [Noviherbaspirillum aerium]